MFQSTHPHGVRHIRCFVTYCQAWFQSTHPHGVRLFWFRFSAWACSFNPRTRTGCDLYKLNHTLLNEFQSTHPHGVRLGYDVIFLNEAGFNPRTRTGCDAPVVVVRVFRITRFNPRTRTGCDSFCTNFLIIQFPVSIHAPARGATQIFQLSFRLLSVSIHAPARGATLALSIRY